MKRGGKILLAVALLGLIVWGAAKMMAPKEPRYDGKPLSYWLVRSESWEHPDDETKTAIRRLGTNALLFLLTDLKRPPAKWRMKWFSYSGRWVPFWGDPPFLARLNASKGFEALGSIAEPAIPQLVALLHDTNAPQDHVALSLAYIGTNGFPPLLGALTNQNCNTRLVAAQALAATQLCPESSVPAIAQMLQSSDFVERWFAAISLEQFGTNARSAAPVLKKLSASDPDRDVQEAAKRALQAMEIISDEPP